MGVYRFREGSVTVELDDGLERLARRYLDALVPGLVARLEAEANDILNQAKAEWPERTGRSRAGLRVFTEITPDTIRVGIENTVEYAIYVKPRQWFGVTTAWERLVRKPMRAAAKDVVSDLGDVLARAVREAVRG